jgi:hypothetical protein
VQIQNSMVLMRDQMLRFYDSVLYTFILYYWSDKKVLCG